MHPQLRIIFVAVTAVFAAVACSSIDNVSSAIQPAHAAVAPAAATVAAPVALAEVKPAAAVDSKRGVPYARPDLSPDPEERKAAVEVQLALAKLNFVQASRLATTPALREMVGDAIQQYKRDRNSELDNNLAMLDLKSRIVED